MRRLLAFGVLCLAACGGEEASAPPASSPVADTVIVNSPPPAPADTSRDLPWQWLQGPICEE